MQMQKGWPGKAGIPERRSRTKKPGHYTVQNCQVSYGNMSIGKLEGRGIECILLGFSEKILGGQS